MTALALDTSADPAPTRPRLTLRSYQREAIDAAYTWHATHTGNCLLVVPTGGGKSLIMGTIAKEAVEAGARVCVIAHRKELIEQNWKALQYAGLPALHCGIVSGQHGRKDRTTPATVASIQTLARNPFQYGPYDLVLIDECHLVSRGDDTSYQKVLDAFRTQRPTVRLIGLTATPYRLDSGRLDTGEKRVFHEIAYEITIETLLEGGFLCPLISKATLVRYDVSGVAMRGGEYLADALQSAVDDPATTDAVIAELLACGADRARWLVFCVGVAHAEHMADALTAAGVPAAAVHGDLSPHERAERLAGLRNGRLRALTNCDVLTTGYDEPSIDLLALCRPTGSTGLHVQMLGRGFRTAPGKENCLVLDFAGNCLTHGPVDAIRIRDPKKKRDGEAPAKECPDCHEIVATATRRCPRCDHAFPPPKPAQLAPATVMAPVMAREKLPPRWVDVTKVTYHRHVPAKRDKQDTLRVEYYYHFQKVATEWVCIEHTGFARTKAEAWWADHLGGPCPRTIDAALAAADGLEVPVAISLEADGRFERVVNYRFHDGGAPLKAEVRTALPTLANALPNTLPNAPREQGPCVFCDHFDELLSHCTHWDAAPPLDVRATGCASYVPFGEAALQAIAAGDDDDLPF